MSSSGHNAQCAKLKKGNKPKVTILCQLYSILLQKIK